MSRSPRMLRIENLLWVLFLVALPVTSFRFFPSGLGGNTLVRPLSVFPMIVLLVIGVAPRLLNQKVTRTLLPLFAFVLMVIASSLLAFMRGIDPVVGVTVLDRTIRTLGSLFLGVGFYLVVTLIPDTPNKLRASLRWLYLGFSVALLWGSLQAFYVVKFQRGYFELLSQIQRMISIRKLFPTRISGLTYEPNWFAEQIAFLLMPWLFTAVFSGFSVFNWRTRWRWLSIELILLVWSAVVLIFTFSRTGMILLAVQLILVFLFRPKSRQDSDVSDRRARMVLVGKRLLQAGITFVVLVGIIVVVGTRNNYFARLWNYWIDEESTGQYLQYISFDQRFTYWGTAYRMYESYPVYGIGPGNFAFYLEEFLPDRPLHPTPELLIKIVPEEGRSQLSSVKGLFPRLLAETGLMGMATFVSFLIALVGCSLFLFFDQEKDLQFWGRGGVLGLFVFLVVSFSFDSFSLPNMWIIFGFISAAAHVFVNSGITPYVQHISEKR